MIVYLWFYVTDSDNNILNGNSPPIASQKAFNIIADSLRRIDVSTLSTGQFGSINAFLFRFVWNFRFVFVLVFIRYSKYALSFQFSHALLLRTENNLWFFSVSSTWRTNHERFQSLRTQWTISNMFSSSSFHSFPNHSIESPIIYFCLYPPLFSVINLIIFFHNLLTLAKNPIAVK